MKYGDFPTPEPKKNEVLIKVKACGLNHLDIWIRQGQRELSMPHILGSDVAGVVEKVNGDSKLKAGQEVVVNPAMPCGQCYRCRQSESCELVKIFGKDSKGGYAEYTIAPVEQVYVKPASLSFTEAAAFPLTFLTAWHMLVSRAMLKKTETVFIWGASGGLGSSAILIAKYLGAKVIAAAKSDAVAEKIRKLGADEVIIYTKNKVEDLVKDIDVVFESVGEKTWSTSLKIARPYGRVVIAGTTSGNMVSHDLSDIYVRQLSVIGARMGTKEEFEKVLKLFETGKLKPIIDRVFPLQDARKAQQRMEAGEHMGKIILEVGV